LKKYQNQTIGFGYYFKSLEKNDFHERIYAKTLNELWKVP
jgi:hypothetical protein